MRLAHETGDAETPYEHTHVVVDFGENITTVNPRFFDLCPKDIPGTFYPTEGGIQTSIHPHIKVLKNEKAYRDALVYISKEDPENEDLKQKDLVSGVLDKRTKLEAIKACAKSYTDVGGISTIFDLKDCDFRTEKPDWSAWTPRPWQKVIIDITKTKPDGRSVYWIYDRKGAKGKSELGEYLEDTMYDLVWMTDDLGDSREAGTIVLNKLSSGWKGNTIIVDLTRCAEHHDRMYDYLERLVNGRITSQKYSGRTIRFNKCHIVVMSNFLPHTDKMSEDRWRISEVMEDYTLRAMTVAEARETCREVPQGTIPVWKHI